jgi:hypothetical protein
MQSKDTQTDSVANGDGIVNWSELAPRVLYPTKTLIIEAMQWIGRPMAANELEEVFEGAFSLSAISYHMTTLAERGILALDRKQRVRGAWEKFYFFAPAVICDVTLSSQGKSQNK